MGRSQDTGALLRVAVVAARLGYPELSRLAALAAVIEELRAVAEDT